MNKLLRAIGRRIAGAVTARSRSLERMVRRHCVAFKPRPIIRIAVGGDDAKPLRLKPFGFTKGDRVIIIPEADFERLLRAARQRTDRNGILPMMRAMEHIWTLESIRERTRHDA